jgi:hypothetical protein
MGAVSIDVKVLIYVFLFQSLFFSFFFSFLFYFLFDEYFFDFAVHNLMPSLLRELELISPLFQLGRETSQG